MWQLYLSVDHHTVTTEQKYIKWAAAAEPSSGFSVFCLS